MRAVLSDSLRIAAFALLVVIGLSLIGDATTYALRPYDPVSGRPRVATRNSTCCSESVPRKAGSLPALEAWSSSLGIPLVLGSARLARAFWRSRMELPLLAVVTALALWKFGKAVFWSFHDADVFLTWRTIGNTPNELAERATAILTFILGIAAIAVTCRRQRLHPFLSLRLLAYATATMTVLAALLLPFLVFPAAWMAVAFALIVLSTPLWMASVMRSALWR